MCAAMLRTWTGRSGPGNRKGGGRDVDGVEVVDVSVGTEALQGVPLHASRGVMRSRNTNGYAFTQRSLEQSPSGSVSLLELDQSTGLEGKSCTREVSRRKGSRAQDLGLLSCHRRDRPRRLRGSRRRGCCPSSRDRCRSMSELLARVRDFVDAYRWHAPLPMLRVVRLFENRGRQFWAVK